MTAKTNGTTDREISGAVLVAGGGIAGIQASLDLSAAGYRVYLVEEKPGIGGTMARLDKTFPTGDCATCIVSPKLVAAMRDQNIDVLTMADVVGLEGEAGSFTAKVRKRARYVDIDKCTGCGDCTKVCPVQLTSDFDAGLGTRQAIDKLNAQAAPNAAFIQKKHRAPCSGACPIDHSVQGYVALIAAGKAKEAAELIRRENPLPGICGRVCFHPCESACNRGEIDAPVSICGLKRYAIDKTPDAIPPKKAPDTGKSVAIIGSGPAGLAAAHALAQQGHGVSVIESLPVLGGMLAVGIPEYRLPPDVLKRDIDAIRALGVTFETGTTVGEDRTTESLVKDFDALFVATGAHHSRKLGIPGEDKQGVVHGVDFLRAFRVEKAPEVEGKKVVIIGGGNTAVDAARTARRLGADKVTVLYRRTRQEMPASPEEIEATLDEGIDIEYLVAPLEVKGQDLIKAVKCQRMALGEPDKSGRRRPVPVEGSEFTVKTDMLIPAVSQSAEERMAADLALETTKWGTIVADEVTLATSREGVFAAGDVVLGPSSVIEAIAGGKQAAAAIHNFLSDRPVGEGLSKREPLENPLTPEEILALRRQRGRAPRAAADERPSGDRVADFDEVVKGFSDEAAVREASRCLNCADCSECMQCVAACGAGAIDHAARDEVVDLAVGAVVLTPGFTPFDAKRRSEFGFAYQKNVVTNLQFERILSAAGPTGGKILRPSDGKHPKTLAFVQCVGSRDSGCGNDYCSSVCCMAATKEAILAKEHEPGLDITIFFMDLRAFGKDFDRYAERAKAMGIKYKRAMISRTFEMPKSHALKVSYTDGDMGLVEEDFDMMVLSLGLEASDSMKQGAKAIGLTLNPFGFAETAGLNPLETSRPGVFVGGAFQEPKDIPDTVMQASAAAAKAMALLAPARGSKIVKKQYPKERTNMDEPPRVGVFICHCGSNIASVVDVEKVVEEAWKFPNVVCSDNNVYTCADDSQDLIKKKIDEYKINRVVIASCTPRTHEPIFRDTLRSAKLNQYLLEMANIRDQCSWVHAKSPEAATEKAVDLVRMAVARASALMPLEEETVPINNGALVIGGGIAGMTASLALAEQGFPVHLVERTDSLGGLARDITRTLEGDDVATYLKDATERVSAHSRITVHYDAEVKTVDGHIGGFTAGITAGGTTSEVKSGVVVVATGAKEAVPTTYGYGEDDRVVTQLQLSKKLASDDFALPDNGTVVMMQCVEQRDENRPYCSRVCCSTAVKNALFLKERFPSVRIAVLYRDIRTYGFREIAYREAREKGVLFVRYDPENPPRLSLNGALEMMVREPALGRDLVMSPDLLVLSAPMVARDNRQRISDLLKVPVNADGFFLEAHMKLRPVDFASEGLFLCGTAHAPKFLSETISQANAVAGRAATILSKKEMPTAAETAWVDPNKCIACMTCVHVCPYGAPHIGKDNKAEIQTAVCMGCGSCTSECPAQAVKLHHYLDTQVLAAMDGLLAPEVEITPVETAYPDMVGIAVPRWHKG